MTMVAPSSMVAVGTSPNSNRPSAMPNSVEVYSNGTAGAFVVALGSVVVSRRVAAERSTVVF